MPLDNLEHNMVLHRYGNLITTKDTLIALVYQPIYALANLFAELCRAHSVGQLGCKYEFRLQILKSDISGFY
mgnify:CR=1 FL=1